MNVASGHDSRVACSRLRVPFALTVKSVCGSSAAQSCEGCAPVVGRGGAGRREVEERLPLLERPPGEQWHYLPPAGDRGARPAAPPKVLEADPLELDTAPAGALDDLEGGRPGRLHREEVPDGQWPAGGVPRQPQQRPHDSRVLRRG